MKRLHLFILKSYLGPLVMTFFITLFILQLQWLWKYIDDLAGKGLDLAVLAELMAYASTTLIPMALPLAILLASLMTFGNLGENYELVALKSAGISLFRIFRILIFFNVIMSIAAFYFSNNVLPWANLKMTALMYDIKNQSPELNVADGAFFNDVEGYSIRVGRKDSKTGALHQIMIYDHTAHRGNVEVTIADSGYMEMTEDELYLVLNLYNGNSYSELKEKNPRSRAKNPHRRDKFKEETLIFEMQGKDLNRTDEGLFKKHFQMLNLKQLQIARDSLKNTYNKRQGMFAKSLLNTKYFKKAPGASRDTFYSDTTKYDRVSIDTSLASLPIDRRIQVGKMAENYARSAKSYVSTTKKDLLNSKKWILRHEIEWHRKFTLSFACLVLFFIGAPLGAIIRKGGFGMPVVVSVLLFILYYVISITGEKFAREGVLPSYEGMWLSSVILLPLGIFLSYKAATDSVILNIDTYLKFFGRIVRLFQNKSE